MATFSLVHGAWGSGSHWDPLRAELEVRGHEVFAPDLPCEDVEAGVGEYAAAVPACDVVVGHSLGGMTIPYVEAGTHVFLCALVSTEHMRWREIFAEGFTIGDARDELGRSYFTDPVAAAAELQVPPEHAHRVETLRRQAPYATEPRRPENPAYIVCSRDAVIRPDWQRHAARTLLGVEPIELDSGHMPMLERPVELAAILDALT